MVLNALSNHMSYACRLFGCTNECSPIYPAPRGNRRELVNSWVIANRKMSVKPNRIEKVGGTWIEIDYQSKMNRRKLVNIR